MDNRKALEPGTVIEVYKNKEETGPKTLFQISREVGRGGSCIVYDASYVDSVGSRHLVRLKESFPYRIKFSRDENGCLRPSPGQEPGFLREQDKFINSYKNQVEIRKEMGLTNITVSAFELYYGRGTVCSVMDYSQGADYGSLGPEELGKTLRRTKAVAGALEQYHRAGYLHLDIKPENIWIIPETMDLVQLFDFDSVIRKEDLKEDPGRKICFTQGFAAPELVSGNVEKTGPAADIYGLGALLFFRLMGTCPQRKDREYQAVYDFSRLREENAWCQPCFFRKLGEFFHRTLASSPSLRFASVNQAAEALEELMKLSDPDRVYGISNFSYHQNCFVGRKKELGEIKERLERKHLLFLHGIGGIGKTELAMNYAYENENRYDTILMLRVEHSLENSLGREDIRLHNFAREESEEANQYARRKLAAMKACLSENDLLILDNFDLEKDELLDEVLESRCRILVTSRYDFSDWNYPQMEVEALENMKDLLTLFKAFNPVPYSPEEMEAVEDLIKLVECHTMLTELLAKNLKFSGKDPSELREKLKETAGTASLDREPVWHRKDKARRQATVQEHLKILFDISELGEKELRLLDNLSLFAGVRVQKRKFLDWCQEELNGELEALIRGGWVESGREDDKISLHQIILDLIYEERKPGGESCKGLIRSMTEYIRKDTENWVERTIRDKLCGIIARRIQGIQEETLDFYLIYCEKIHCEPQWLSLCQEEFEKREEECGDQLARIWCVRGKEKLEEILDLEHAFEEEPQKETGAEAISCLEKAAWYKERSAGRKEYGEFLYFLGKYCGSVAENLMLEEAASILVDSFAVRCMEQGTAIYEGEEERDEGLLTEMYDSLIEFYDPEAFTMVRPERFGDIKKRLYYARKREEIHPSKTVDENGIVSICVDTHQMSLTDAGEQAERLGHLEEAAEYFLMAEEAEEEEAEFYVDQPGYLYEKAGQHDKALAYFMERYEGQSDTWLAGERALAMGRLFRKKGQYEEAARYLEESMEFFQRKQGHNIKEVRWKEKILENYQELSRIPGDKSQEYWERGLEFYEQERKEVSLTRGALDFQIERAKRLITRSEEERRGWENARRPSRQQNPIGEMLIDGGRNCLEHYESAESGLKIVEMAERIWRKLPKTSMQIQLLIICGDLFQDMIPENREREKEFYGKALELLEKKGKGKKLQAMKLRKKLAEICNFLDLQEEARAYDGKCDYVMLARAKAKEIRDQKAYDATAALKDQMEVWQEAGDKLKETGMDRDSGRRLGQAIRCYGQAISLWKRMDEEGKKKSLYSFCQGWERLAEIQEARGKHEKARKAVFSWRGELVKRIEERTLDRWDMIRQINNLIRIFEKIGETDWQTICVLERGILELEAEEAYDWQKPDLGSAGEAFFRRVDQGISKKQMDTVLDICQDILKLCQHKEKQELAEVCQNVIKRYREEQVSFK